VNTAKENNVVFALAHFVYICKYFPVKTDKYIKKKLYQNVDITNKATVIAC